VLNAIFYVLSTGCQWQALPKDLPPKSTLWDCPSLWDLDGTLERIHHTLYAADGRPQAPCPDRQRSVCCSRGRASVHDVQDRDGAEPLLRRSVERYNVMSGRIWTPPDCNGFGKGWSQGHNC
jgi:hypothetical protein